MPWTPTNPESIQTSVPATKEVWKYRIEGFAIRFDLASGKVVVQITYSWGWLNIGWYEIGQISVVDYDDVLSYYNAAPEENTIIKSLEKATIQLLVDRGELPSEGTWSAF